MSSPAQNRNARRASPVPAIRSDTSQPWTRPAELANHTTPSRNATEFSIETSASPMSDKSLSSNPRIVPRISGSTVTSPWAS